MFQNGSPSGKYDLAQEEVWGSWGIYGDECASHTGDPSNPTMTSDFWLVKLDASNYFMGINR